MSLSGYSQVTVGLPKCIANVSIILRLSIGYLSVIYRLSIGNVSVILYDSIEKYAANVGKDLQMGT